MVRNFKNEAKELIRESCYTAIYIVLFYVGLKEEP